MARLRATAIAGGALAWTLCACTGTIESSSFGIPGRADPARPWAPGTDTPGALGSPGVPGQGVAGNAAPGVNGGAGGPGVVTPPGTVDELRCETPAVGPSPLRRLTHAEYDNSVRDLLGDTTRPAHAFARDTEIGLFDNTASAQTVPQLLGDQYIETAAELAENVADVDALLGCDAADATCVRAFVERFGRRAYRRPLASTEVDRLVAIYDSTRTAADAPTGVRAIVTAVLASPNFLFRPEFGGAESTLPSAKEATPFELAGRLASLLWASLPDDALLDAAQNGQLQTREQVQIEARRMLADPKAREGLANFYMQWFGLPLLESATKDPAVYPAFDDALRAAMAEETRRFVDYVLWDDDATLNTLLTAPYSFVNGELAQLYGVSGPTGATFARVEHDSTRRRGVLTQASMLAAFASSDESSPVKRGKWVRTRILCQDLPDPPDDIPELTEPKEGVSTRERFAMHTSDPACSGCHTLIDGLGFGLEAYDGIGAFRTMDHGVPVDSSGEITSTRDIDGQYDGGPELALKLAQSAQVRDCAPTQWLRFALARRETQEDTCSLVALREAFAASGGDLRELMVALTQTDAFWNYRQAE
jgi:hypothetical protein